jgi:hypothetical protein
MGKKSVPDETRVLDLKLPLIPMNFRQPLGRWLK